MDQKLCVWISLQRVIKPFFVMLELSRFALEIGQAQEIKSFRVEQALEFLAMVGAYAPRSLRSRTATPGAPASRGFRQRSSPRGP